MSDRILNTPLGDMVFFALFRPYNMAFSLTL